MARNHRMTPKRRAALRKAQLASARKRHSNRKRVAIGATLAIAGGVAAYYGSKRVMSVRRKQGNQTAPPTVSHKQSLVSKIDHDSIPFYNPLSSKSWPHVPADKARKRNKKLRRQEMLE